MKYFLMDVFYKKKLGFCQERSRIDTKTNNIETEIFVSPLLFIKQIISEILCQARLTGIYLYLRLDFFIHQDDNFSLHALVHPLYKIVPL